MRGRGNPAGGGGKTPPAPGDPPPFAFGPPAAGPPHGLNPHAPVESNPGSAVPPCRMFWIPAEIGTRTPNSPAVAIPRTTRNAMRENIQATFRNPYPTDGRGGIGGDHAPPPGAAPGGADPPEAR